MKAFILKGNGGIENLQLKEVPMPEIGANELLVKTRAISMNPVDVAAINIEAVRNGLMAPVAGEDIIVGWDIAGDVIDTGSAVVGIKKGDRVFGCIKFPGQGKAYAEFVAAPANEVAVIPDGVSYEAAAAACMAAITAYLALVTHRRISSNDKVLIHGAAGGVGHFAVQIAKSFGAYVIGTASTANLDFVLSLGADKVIDYKKDKFEDIVRDPDLVLDSINAANLMRSLDAVKPGGRIVSLIAEFDGEIAEKAKAKKVTGTKIGVVSNGDDMKKICALIASGKLHSEISQTFTFNDLPRAAEAIGRNLRGKIAISVS